MIRPHSASRAPGLWGPPVVALTVLVLFVGATCAGPSDTDPAAPSPTADASQDSTRAASDTGLLLAVLVPPVLLVALAWLAYIFRLIFREPTNGQPPKS